MLYTGSGSLPNHIYCWVESYFVRKDTKRGIFEPCIWFALRAKAEQSWMCHVMLECGAVYRDLPPHAISFSETPEKDWNLKDTALWDCYSDQFSIIRYDYLNGRRAEIRKTGLFGRYLFTAIPMYDSYTTEPSQSKEFMFIQLDNGRLIIMPTNELRFFDNSWTEGDWPKDIKLNSNIWRIE